jgi:UDP-N-acetylglucosamine 4,6-dehydratase
MTRFWITLEQGVCFVVECLERMQGGEIFVPKIPSVKITDLARAIAPECEMKIVGIRPGEKLHEVMIPEDDAHHSLEYERFFAILPVCRDWSSEDYCRGNGGTFCSPGFRYSSETNSEWLSVEELRKMVAAFGERANV